MKINKPKYRRCKLISWYNLIHNLGLLQSRNELSAALMCLIYVREMSGCTWHDLGTRGFQTPFSQRGKHVYNEFNIIHFLFCDYNHPCISTNAHSLYKITNHLLTLTLLRVSEINCQPQGYVILRNIRPARVIYIYFRYVVLIWLYVTSP
jgi:hypothetical protein